MFPVLSRRVHNFWQNHARLRVAVAAALSSAAVSCIQTTAAPGANSPASGTSRNTAVVSVSNDPSSAGPQATSAEIPVNDHDATWGNPQAPCTIVTFQDLQCPFCGRSWETLNELERRYGPKGLRFVYKHFPLPFHDDAMPYAEANKLFERDES